MEERVTLRLMPAGIRSDVPPGTPLRDLLYRYGIEFPCGGRGKCAGCKVKLIDGHLAAASGPNYRLSDDEIAAGWRLACKHDIEGDLTLEVQQWESVILTDNTRFDFVPRDGYGIAIDLGTTTLAAQLLDLRTGHVLGVRTAKNPQGQFGADIMSRITFALENGGHAKLQALIRDQLAELIRQLIDESRIPDLRLSRVVLVGNTPMQHLFCGFDATPLAFYPYHSQHDDAVTNPADALGWDLPGNPSVTLLANLGGFVGSDILAGVIATRLHDRDKLLVFVDLGTNGEMVVGNRHELICASAAAGPAFEAARIAMGMQATTGAISEAVVKDGVIHCSVIGGGPAKGICGSGLVDAAAAALELGLIDSRGRLNQGEGDLPLLGPVSLTQGDVRELQLAKGAVAAGIRILLKQLGKTLNDVEEVLIAGAFGNYIRLASAQRIGLLKFPLFKMMPVGNTALLGAKLALFMDDAQLAELESIRGRIRHISLSSDPDFQDIYVDEMMF